MRTDLEAIPGSLIKKTCTILRNDLFTGFDTLMFYEFQVYVWIQPISISLQKNQTYQFLLPNF